mmetsp:Transcript_28653/g.50971  ORF Transcript_28653/g.50971 Transcript_28653/m.50971 type:complete len:1061 (+) Transcript_28653:3556-6738(+)
MLRLATSCLRMNAVSRGFAYQPSQFSQFSHEINKSLSPATTLEMLRSTELNHAIPHGLRILGRNLRSNRRDMNILNEEAFKEVKQRLMEGTATLRGQDLADIFFFEKVAKSFRKNAFSLEEKRVFLGRLDELIENQDLTTRQVFSVFVELSASKFVHNSVERAVLDIISDSTIPLLLFELKMVAQSIDLELHYSYFKILRNITGRIKTSELESVQTVDLIETLGALKKHISSFRNTYSSINHISSFLIDRLENMSELELSKLIFVFEDKEVQSTLLYNKLLEVVAAKLTASPYMFSDKFFNQVSSSLVKYKENGRFVPESFVKTFSSAALAKFKTEEPSYYSVVKIIDVLASYKHDPQIMTDLLNMVKTLQDSPHSLACFMLLANFPHIKESTDGVLDIESVSSVFNNLHLNTKAQALAILAKAGNSLEQKWKDKIVSFEEITVKELTANNRFSSVISKLSNYPDVMHSSSLPTLKAGLLEAIKNEGDIPKVGLRILATLAPWNYKELEVLIGKVEVPPGLFNRLLSELNPEFPFDTLVDILAIHPEAASFRNLMKMIDFLDSNISAGQLIKYLNFLVSAEEFDLRIGNAIKLSKLIRHTFDKIRLSNTIPLPEIINQKLLATEDHRINEHLIHLALSLNEFGRLDKEVAKKIVTFKMSSTNFNRAEILELASKIYADLDTDAVRLKIIHPILSSGSLESNISALPHILAWPTNEGALEIQYTNSFVQLLSNINRGRDGRVFEVLSNLVKGKNDAHTELYNKLSETVTQMIPRLLDINISSNLEKLAKAYAKSSVKSKAIEETMEESFKVNLSKLWPSTEASLHTGLYERDIRNPFVSEEIAKKLVGDFKKYKDYSVDFSFELADLGFMNEPWALNVVKSTVDYAEKQVKRDYQIVRFVFSLIFSGATPAELEPWLAKLNKSSYKNFTKTMLLDYFRLQNITGEAAAAAVSYELFYPSTRIFNIGLKAATEIATSFEQASFEAKIYENVDGIEVPIYLPQKKTAVFPLMPKSYFSDWKTVRGTHQLYMDLVKARGIAVVALSNRTFAETKPEELVKLLAE